MNNKFTNKKLLLVLIIVLIGASIGGAILYSVYFKPSNYFSVAARKERACLSTVTPANISQIFVQKIENSNRGDLVLDSKTTDYLFCEAFRSGSVASLVQTEAFLDDLSTDVNQKNTINTYVNASVFNRQIFDIAFKDFEKLCSTDQDRYEQICSLNRYLSIGSSRYLQKPGCGLTCDNLLKLEQTKDYYNFPGGGTIDSVSARLALAFKFFGSEKAKEVCNSEKDDQSKAHCLALCDILDAVAIKNPQKVKSGRSAAMFELDKDCRKSFEDARKEICSW